MISKRRIGILAASLCVATGAAAVATPAHAQPAGVGSATVLLLSVSHAEQPELPARTALLRCDVDGGTHRDASAACDELRAVDGDWHALPDQGGMCTKEYRPVTATAVGVWDGRPTSYRATFSNRCLLLHATGSVFDF